MTLTAFQPAVPVAFGIRATHVRVADFRILGDVEVELAEGTTILLGENNTGKSTLLAALSAAFGRSRMEPEDLHQSPGRLAGSAHVDVRFAPSTGARFSDTALNLLGDAIELGDVAGTSDWFAVRFTATYDGVEIKTRRAFLKGWGPAAEEKLAPAYSTDVSQLIAFDILDAQRDVVVQLRNRRTTWNEVASLADVAAADRLALELQLKTLSDTVTDKSAMLARVRRDLGDLGKALASGPLQIDINTIPRKLGDLVRSMDITVGAENALPFGASAQGMGTRSLAALLVFRSAVNNVSMPAGITTLDSIRVSAFEEPEAHLHPQAQQAVFATIDAIGGQKIVTTHSTHLVASAPTRAFRLFRRVGAGARVASTAGYPGADLADVERLFLKRHPHALFAKVVGLVEGDSDHLLLELLARSWWQGAPDTVGVSLLCCDGVGKSVYFAPFLEKLGVPWVFLRDGDGEGVKAEAALLSKLREVLGLADGAPDPPLSVVALSGMIEDELDALGAAVVDPVLDHHPAGPLNDYADRLDGQKKKGGTVRDYKGDAGRARARRDLLAQDKPATARVFGEYLAGVNPATWPVGLQAFFKKIDALCGRPPKEIS